MISENLRGLKKTASDSADKKNYQTNRQTEGHCKSAKITAKKLTFYRIPMFTKINGTSIVRVCYQQREPIWVNDTSFATWFYMAFVVVSLLQDK